MDRYRIWASLTQWRLGGLGRLGRHDALLANGSLARLFWRALDASDYWLTQARLWAAGSKTQCPTLRDGGWEVALDAAPPVKGQLSRLPTPTRLNRMALMGFCSLWALLAVVLLVLTRSGDRGGLAPIRDKDGVSRRTKGHAVNGIVPQIGTGAGVVARA